MSTPNAAIKAWRREPVDSVWYRLIPSRFPPIQVYERVVANDRYAEVAELEVLTSPRVRARQRLIGIGAVDEASPKLQNWNHAPFTYLNPDGSTLFRPNIAALELWDTLQSALTVSVMRRERFLRSTGMPKLGLDMRVLTTRITGSFVDLRDVAIPDDKEARWKIGDDLAQSKASGALFRCTARNGSTCLSVLSSEVLDRSVQADHFRFAWDGQRIASLYSFSGKGTEIDAALLAGAAIESLG